MGVTSLGKFQNGHRQRIRARSRQATRKPEDRGQGQGACRLRPGAGPEAQDAAEEEEVDFEAANAPDVHFWDAKRTPQTARFNAPIKGYGDALFVFPNENAGALVFEDAAGLFSGSCLA